MAKIPLPQDAPWNWTETNPSSLQQDRGSFLGVAAVDIEAKSLGQYPLANARGCYSITVDQKGSVLYHPVLYKSTGNIEFDQKLHLYSFLDKGDTMQYVEKSLVFQNLSETVKLPYLEVRNKDREMLPW